MADEPDGDIEIETRKALYRAPLQPDQDLLLSSLLQSDREVETDIGIIMYV